MYKKIFFIILISVFLSNCGFAPIYSNKKDNNFSIDSLTLNGDRTINNFLQSDLKKFQNKKNNKLLSLKINTDYKKEILVKDKTAKIQSYRLSNISSIEISSNDKIIKKINISSMKDMDSIDDEFEEEKNERIIKQNFGSEIANQIIIELSILDDY